MNVCNVNVLYCIVMLEIIEPFEPINIFTDAIPSHPPAGLVSLYLSRLDV